MLRVVRSFVRAEDGMEQVEWAITAVLIAFAAVSSLTSLSADIPVFFANLNTLVVSLP